MNTATGLIDDTFIPVKGSGTGSGAIPVQDIIPWAVFGALIAMIFLYFVSTEQGAVSLFAGTNVHEFVHDGRHLLGFPCH